MHLLDIPKPNRSPLLPYFTLLAATYFSIVLWWSPRPEPGLIRCGPRRFLKTVKYITVTTVVSLRNDRPDFIDTHQMPLIELYDELEKRTFEKHLEVAKKNRGRCGNMSLEEQDEIFLPVEKAFAKKYGLKIKQVKMIRHEGYWLKDEGRK